MTVDFDIVACVVCACIGFYTYTFQEPTPPWRFVIPLPDIYEWPLFPFDPGHFLAAPLNHVANTHGPYERVERLRLKVFIHAFSNCMLSLS